MIGAEDVTEAVRATLAAHLAAVLARLAVEGKPNLPPPAAVDTLPTFDAARLQTLPLVVVSVPGLSAGDAAPRRDGRGRVSATWSAVVTVAVRGEGYAATLRAAQTYATAVRGALLTHPTLGGLASGVAWVAEEYDRLAPVDARTIGAAFVQVDVTIPDVLAPRPVATDPAPPVVTTTAGTVTPR